MTRRHIILMSLYGGRLDPELGLILKRVAILVTGRHIGRDTTCSPMVEQFGTEQIPRWKLGWRDFGVERAKAG
jgi:hypothetical protein